MERLKGGCACGAVRYELLAKPMRVHCCHCNNCQRQTDAPHDIYRCPKCQVALWSNYGRRPKLRFVRVGTLDNAAVLRPDIHIYTRAKEPWVKIPKGAPAFRDYYDRKKVWPARELARLEASLSK